MNEIIVWAFEPEKSVCALRMDATLMHPSLSEEDRVKLMSGFGPD